MVTINTVLASTRGGLDQSTTTGRRIPTSYVDDGCLNSSRSIIFPGSHRDGAKPWWWMQRQLNGVLDRIAAKGDDSASALQVQVMGMGDAMPISRRFTPSCLASAPSTTAREAGAMSTSPVTACRSSEADHCFCSEFRQ